MKIGEVSKLTGISSSNIRYYEETNLIDPERNPLNDYRVYTQSDIEKLKEIKLLRKLDISIEDIKKLQSKKITLDACMDKNIEKLDKKNRNLEIRKKLCREIKSDKDSLEKINTNLYLNKIEDYEKQGVKFKDMANDFMKKIKKSLPKEATYWFDPEEPIMTKEEFTNELFNYAKEKNLDLTVVKESMEPEMIINGKKYVGMLQMPRLFKFPLSIFFALHTYGYRAAFLFEVEDF